MDTETCKILGDYLVTSHVDYANGLLCEATDSVMKMSKEFRIQPLDMY